MSDTGSLGEANASGAMGAPGTSGAARERGSRQTPGNAGNDRSTTSELAAGAGRTMGQDDEAQRAASEDYAGHTRAGRSPSEGGGGSRRGRSA